MIFRERGGRRVYAVLSRLALVEAMREESHDAGPALEDYVRRAAERAGALGWVMDLPGPEASPEALAEAFVGEALRLGLLEEATPN